MTPAPADRNADRNADSNADRSARRALQDETARRLRGQAASCTDLGSPLYGALLRDAAADVDAGGPVWEALAPLADLPGGSLLPLRFMGATHRLALDGDAPDLAAHYPSCCGDGDPTAAWPALRSTAGHPRLRTLLAHGVQTNEVGRSGALLGGFLAIARRTGLPLRVLEVGSSAGLNLRFDRFRYAGWGDPASPVDQGDLWIGDVRPTLEPARIAVVERRGCDPAPVDPTSPDGRLTLLSYVWPDQERRFGLLDAACRVAAEFPVDVERASGDVWVAERLATPVDGVATVVFHSVVLPYLEEAARARLVASLVAAGARATREAPLAWLRLEPPGPLGPPDFEVRLTTWPEGEDRRLALCHPHGSWVRWLA